jgi:hypothetical protein
MFSSPPSFPAWSTIGENPLSSVLCDYEKREVPFDVAGVQLSNYGTIGGGLETMRLAAPKLTHQWAIRNQGETPPPWGPPPLSTYSGSHRCPPKLFTTQPVDIVFWDQGHKERSSLLPTSPVELALASTDDSVRPSFIFEAWGESASTWREGPVSKIFLSRWKTLGYQTHCRWVPAVRVGGAIDQTRLLVVRQHHRVQKEWEWARMEEDHIRPMSNLLSPPGLTPGWVYRQAPNGPAPDAQGAPMPGQPGRYITDSTGRTRRLEVDEFIRGLGGPVKGPPQFGKSDLRPSALRTTSLYHWEYLITSLSQNGSQHATARSGKQSPAHPPTGGQTAPTTREAPTPFHWCPPDLNPGSPWYTQRVANLQRAAACYPNPEYLTAEGLKMLEIHRGNYDEVGAKPQRLQLLWWEFPREHWDALREGSPMNFILPPPETIHDNAPMDEDQLVVACEFVDELIGLGTLAPLDDQQIKATAPLFCIPKEGQPGQWRVIADMLRGGQNSAIGNDPVFLPRLLNILGEMYEGGWSAVVDASKFFYQFGTHPDDRPFLGIKHPRTGQLLAYLGLPMGAGNSPALGNRYGLALLRKLTQEHPDIFQGKLKANGFLAAFTKSPTYDPSLGEGFIIQTPNGMVVKIWAFVDDFLIHAQTKELCERALTAFLDAALDCGMLCHPQKLVPPNQDVRYCGLIFDTHGVPTLLMPEDKKERAGAMVEYATSRPGKEWSRLALAVLAGTLESLAECTPQRIGHTHLRSLYGVIHSDNDTGGLEAYLSTTRLGDRTLVDLRWWRDHLRDGQGRVVRTQHSGTLIPTFGDGSGTGTGGTIHLPDAPLQMWKGQWSPIVYRFSSNWKELTTLLLTLEHIAREGPGEVQGATVFYFTDNSTTYWISQKGSSRYPSLHEQIEKIRTLETRLGCLLTVIHIPGKVMIQEGTDGLSRGLWMTPLQDTIPRDILMPSIFAPLAFDPKLVGKYVNHHLPLFHAIESTPLPPGHPHWEGRRWDNRWEARDCFGRLTVWFPPPEVAQGVLSFLLNCQVEVPLTTSALVFIPRVMAAKWRGLSRKLSELQQIDPRTADLSFPPVLPIPTTVLYMPCHVRRPPSKDRLDRPPRPFHARWHDQQAALMRGVQESHHSGTA